MSLVTLDEAKLHLRVRNDLEDDLITLYIAAADDHVCNFCNLTALPTGDSPEIVPAAMRAAALLIVGDLFENRESQTDKELYANAAAESLLYPYRENLGM